MRVYKVKDYDEMSRRAAHMIAAQVILKPDCKLGLATGSTPKGTYDYLIKWHKENYLDFKDVTIVNLDEYKGLCSDNEQSYHYYMKNRLIKHINVKEENTFIPDGSELDSEKACKEFSYILKRIGRLDLQVLGMGHNGHIGFNEPGDSYELGVHCVDLTEMTIKANSRFFDSISEVPTQAYTMGIKDIMSSKKILFIANGECKAEIVKKAFFGPVTPQVPASILQLHNDFTIIADEAALSLVEGL